MRKETNINCVSVGCAEKMFLSNDVSQIVGKDRRYSHIGMYCPEHGCLFSLSIFNPFHRNCVGGEIKILPFQEEALDFYEKWYGKFLDEDVDDFIM